MRISRYAYRRDLLDEFIVVSKKRLQEISGSRISHEVSEAMLIERILTKRLNVNGRKTDDYTIEYMIRAWNAKLLKPQRLVSAGMAEEEKRCLAPWRLFDWVMRLACFEDISDLGRRSWILRRSERTCTTS